MNPDKANPYAPPTPVSPEEEQRLGAIHEMDVFGVVRFAGRVTEQELDEYLRVDGNVGCARLSLLGIGFGSILLLLPMLSISFLAVSVGGIGLVSIVLAVSTLTYRRWMFVNANPDWGEFVEGAIQREGIRLNRQTNSTFYRWKWYGESHATRHLIALLPATQTASPLLITREMLSSAEDWDTVRRIALAVGGVAGGAPREDVHRDENLRILKDQKRGWSFQPPDDAIAFEGIVWSEDYTRLPPSFLHRDRPLRTYVVIYGLVICIGLILAGCSGLMFQQIALLPVLIAIYFLAAIAIGRRRRRNKSDIVFYLRGYALDGSLVTDFGLAVSETKWAGLSVVSNTDEHVVLRRCSINNFIVIRRDMLGDGDAWIQFRRLIHEKLDGEDTSPSETETISKTL